MKKTFKFYAISWAILLALYNLIVFAFRFTITYDARFWIAYGAVTIAFIGQLLCAGKAFGSGSASKLFLNLPLITLSYSSTIVMATIGSICMLIPNCPAWITLIACGVCLAFSAIPVLKATAAAELVGNREEQVKAQTSFIRTMTMEAECLMNSTEDAKIKAELKKMYEAFRYSDTVSNDSLTNIQADIQQQFILVQEAIQNGNRPTVNMISSLLERRNLMCKKLKRG